ncbi:nucleoside phosphorylase domain-containing protein [Ilyonectria destructans]|nr:nucleoside phosphorylase domain-containing protein [Ilyonectria destructans]
MSDPQDYTVGWVCATISEYVAAQEFLDEEHQDEEQETLGTLHPDDANHYTLGRIGKHHVVVAFSSNSQSGAASNTAIDMVRSFPNIRIALLVGIGYGARNDAHDIRLGDVVVGYGRDGVFQYDFDSTVENHSFQDVRFFNQPPLALQTTIAGMQAQYKRSGHQLEQTIDCVFEKNPRLREEYQRPQAPCDLEADGSNTVPRHDNPAIHFGTVASSNRLMTDAAERKKLAADSNVLCFETEEVGLNTNFPCLFIRGICGHSDSNENKEWQGYAAMAAAAYAHDLLSRTSTEKLQNEARICRSRHKDLLWPNANIFGRRWRL